MKYLLWSSRRNGRTSRPGKRRARRRSGGGGRCSDNVGRDEQLLPDKNGVRVIEIIFLNDCIHGTVEPGCNVDQPVTDLDIICQFRTTWQISRDRRGGGNRHARIRKRDFLPGVDQLGGRVDPSPGGFIVWVEQQDESQTVRPQVFLLNDGGQEIALLDKICVGRTACGGRRLCKSKYRSRSRSNCSDSRRCWGSCRC